MSNPAPGWQKYPDHIVDLKPYPGTVSVRAGDQLIAHSERAIEVVESRHGTVWYLPLEDVQAELSASDTETYCPFKGYASYRNLELPEATIADALWLYESPYDECAAIQGYVSFYTDKVTVNAEPA
ncbi:MAG: DUF427 domain-containing protein [Pseudomonadales bacterium]